MCYRDLSVYLSIKRGIAMSITRNLTAVVVCATACSQVQALLSVNVLQDNTTLPGWVINTFTVDSDTDLTVAVALSELSSGSMLQVPGLFSNPIIRPNGPGDSYISINDDPFTNAGLTAGDLTRPADPPPATFDDTGIAIVWRNTRTNDIGAGMHLATLTFSDDTVGDLELWALSVQGGKLMNTYSLDGGFVSLINSISPPPLPDPPIDTDPLPETGTGGNTGTGTGTGTGGNTNPGSGLPGDSGPTGSNNPIPEPAGLGLLAVAAAMIGGLHRRRLGAA